jgi:single-strand DNA-binding protein
MFVGNIGKEIELKHTASGMAVCNFSIATTDSIKKGEVWENSTTWVKLVCFGKNAEHLSKYAKVGTMIIAEAKYETNSYKDASGEKKYSHQFNASLVRVLTGGVQNGEQSSSQESGQESLTGTDLPADDLPF